MNRLATGPQASRHPWRPWRSALHAQAFRQCFPHPGNADGRPPSGLSIRLAGGLRSIPHLAPGIPYTLLISFGGLAIGFIIGIIFGLLRISPTAWLRMPPWLYRNLSRNPCTGTGPVHLLRPAATARRPDQCPGRRHRSHRRQLRRLHLGDRTRRRPVHRTRPARSRAFPGLSRVQTFRYIIWPQASDA